MRVLVLVPLLLGLAACANTVGDRGRDLVNNYCLKTSPVERELMRLQMSTEKGPLLTIHCENL
jgi:hypothetical protein